MTEARLIDSHMPRSVDAEASVLAQALVSRDVALDVVQVLDVEDFYEDRHRKVFKLLDESIQAGLSLDTISIRDRAETDDLKQCIFSLQDSSEYLATDTAEMILILKQKRQAREVVTLCRDGQVAAMAGKPEALTDLIAKTLELKQSTRGKVALSSQQLATEYLEHLDAVATGKKTAGIDFGFMELDNLTNGAKPGQLIYVAARTSQGKSALLGDMAMNMLEQGKSVYFVSAESSRLEMMDRVVGRLSGLGHNRLQTRLGDDDLSTVTNALGQFNDYKLNVNDDSEITSERILVEANRLKLQGKLDVLFVDYVQFLRDPIRGKELETYRIGRISATLKRIARTLDIPVIAACQVNREATSRQDEKAPRLSDLKDSGSLEQDADVVLGLWREDDLVPVTSVRVLKHRNGPKGSFELKFNGELCRFQDLRYMPDQPAPAEFNSAA